jgi:hypothetical protein
LTIALFFLLKKKTNYVHRKISNRVFIFIFSLFFFLMLAFIKSYLSCFVVFFFFFFSIASLLLSSFALKKRRRKKKCRVLAFSFLTIKLK